ncbi:hypothetical protein KR054_006173 [Drosophila jambulina]|nr:hypothetical protein KR054_006173 [Drosophila jambulina]
MASREPPQTAIVINLLIGDLVQDAVNEPRKLSKQKDTCQRLFDILGFQADDSFESMDDSEVPSTPSADTLQGTSRQCSVDVKQRTWHSWLNKALEEESSEDDVEIFRKDKPQKKFDSTSVQTEQPRFRRRVDRHRLPPLSPCELTRQTIFIDAVSVPIPNALGRPPLADRVCYMLTDFASALYCSLAIMCCCTPNMLR